MTNLVISSDFNLSNPSDFFGNNPVRTDMSSTGFHVYDVGTGNNVYITGQNIAYNSAGQAVSGTVTGIVCIAGNGQETLFNMSGANISIAYDNSQDWASFGQELNYWLGSNPTITTVPGGINGSQTIQAPTGANQVYGYTGHNTVVYTTPSTKFTINVDSLLSPSNGQVTVYQGDPLAPTSANTMHAVQTVQFSDQSIQTQWLTKASLLHTTDVTEFTILSEMYLAYFNRAPDALGLDYWASQAYDWHAAQPGVAMSQINKDIANVFAGTPEAISTYGSVTQQSSAAELQNFVTKVYQNVLDRAPDSAGLNYWVNNLQTGASSPGSFIRDVIYSVNAQSGTADKVYLSSKQTVADYFSVQMGLTNVTQAQNVMNTFNHTYETSGATAAINAANAQTNSYMSEASLTANPELIIHLVGVHG